jgi:hypothetical protein
MFQRDAQRSVAVLGIHTKLLAAAYLGNHGLFGHGLDPIVVVLGRAEGGTGSGNLAAAGTLWVEVIHGCSSW